MSIIAPLCRMTVFIVGVMVSMEFLVLIQLIHQQPQCPYIHKTYSTGKLSNRLPLVIITLVQSLLTIKIIAGAMVRMED